jgi:iron complex outermembrane recepter protein
MYRRICLLAISISLILFICVVSQAFAQESVPEDFTLEEITVTAQKRAENQQKVAIAMDTISGDEMKELGQSDLDEILSTVSSAFINRAGDGMRVSIRGMADDITPTGQLQDMSNSTPSVAVNMDGVFTARRASGSALYDLERVEVLYGPQSTLYASNSPGGIVNIVTANPKIDKYEASGTLEYGNYNLIHTEGSMNAPISDVMAIRASFNASVHDGFMANGSDDEDTKSARLKVLFKPVEKFSFVATGEYSRSGGNGFSGITMFKSQDDVNDPWDNGSSSNPTPRYQSLKKLTGNIDWDLGFGTLTFVPSYSKSNENATMTMTDFSGNATSQTMVSSGIEKGGEMRIASSSESYFKWIIGANYYRADQTEHSQSTTSLSYQDRVNNRKSYAFYGNVTYPISDALRATGGIRQSSDRNYTLFHALMQNPFDSTKYDPVDDSTLVKYNSPDYKIGFEYDLGVNSMIYSDWSTSYRTMGMSQRATKPEKLNSYSIGSKNRFLGNKLQVNASGYYYDYSDALADAGMVDPDTGRMDAGSTTNGMLRIFGADISTNAIIGANDKVNFSVAYMNSKYTKLFFDFESASLADADYSGSPKTFSPEWTINATYNHNFNFSNGSVLTTRFDIRYQTSFFVTFNRQYSGPGVPTTSLVGYNEQEAYHISNFSAIYTHSDGKWTLTGYVKNLENYAVKKNLMMGTMMIGEPRTCGLVLSVRY